MRMRRRVKRKRRHERRPASAPLTPLEITPLPTLLRGSLGCARIVDGTLTRIDRINRMLKAKDQGRGTILSILSIPVECR